MQFAHIELRVGVAVVDAGARGVRVTGGEDGVGVGKHAEVQRVRLHGGKRVKAERGARIREGMDGRRYLAFVPQHGRGSEGPVQRAAALVRPQVQARTVQRARHAHVPVPLRREGRDLEGNGQH